MDRQSVKAFAKALVRPAVPTVLLGLAWRARNRGRGAPAVLAALFAYWAAMYARYRRRNVEQTKREYDLLARTNWDAFTRHYNERVGTVEEEFDVWGSYHQHRHEMRYDLVAAAVRDHLPAGGRILDVGCGAGLVADRLLDIDSTYVGVDFTGRNIEYAATKFKKLESTLTITFARCDGEHLPFPDERFDVVVLTEVIEHLLHPERGEWEVARVLRPGGVFVMTTNNASEVPCRSPLTQPFAWAEKAVGATHPALISLRPWVWPYPVDRDLLPPDSPDVYLPHTHHIYAETKRLFAAAGLDTFQWSTFEFPPPQSATAQWLEARGGPGLKVVDTIEAVARRTPVVRRLGCHLFMLSRKQRPAIAPTPPEDVWPGPLTNGARSETR